jgi:Zn-dependent metalloprotease
MRDHRQVYRFRHAMALFMLTTRCAFQVHGQISADERTRLLLERARLTETATTLLHAERTALGLAADNNFEPASSAYDDVGRLHVRFRRFYKGVRVMGGDIKFSVDSAGATGRVNTRPRQVIGLPSIKPAIAQSELKGIICRDLRVSEPDVAIETQLVIYEGLQQVHLAWLSTVTGNRVTRKHYLVDAHTGAIQRSWSGLTTALVPKKNKGMPFLYDHFVDIDHVLDTGDNRIRLQDLIRQTKVYDMRDQAERWDWKGELFSQDASDLDIEPVWGNGEDWVLGGDTFGPPGQTAAVEAFYAARLTYDMLFNVLGRDGLDDDNGTVRLRVHYRKDQDEHYGDANWDGTYANFGDGTTTEAWSRTDTNTVAHELGHALWDYAVTHDNEGGERRGLNEGHGDIMGAIVDHYRALADGAGSIVPTNAPGKLEWTASSFSVTMISSGP